jgi:hypothetical protein
LKIDKQNIGNAGEYYIAYILSANGFTTTITLGRAEAYDILAVTPDKKKTIKIQIKTSWKDKKQQWKLNKKFEDIKSDDFYFFFINLYKLDKTPEFWVVKSEFVSKYIKERHKIWLNTPGKNNQKHNDNSMREFKLEIDKYTPKKYEKELENIINNENSIKLLLDDDKK